MDRRCFWGLLASLGLAVGTASVLAEEKPHSLSCIGMTPRKESPLPRLEIRAASEEGKPCLAVQPAGGVQATCPSLSLPGKKGKRVQVIPAEGRVHVHSEGMEARAERVLCTGEGGTVLELVGKAQLHCEHEGQQLEVKAERIVVNLGTGKVELQLEGNGSGSPYQQSVPMGKEAADRASYRIQSADILYIHCRQAQPKVPYRVEAGDKLQIRGDMKKDVTVGADGTIRLNCLRGPLRVAGYTLEEVLAAIREHTVERTSYVSLVSFRGVEQTRGEHVVTPDGTINLGTYGCVNVVGLTVAEAQARLKRYLREWMEAPSLSVEVVGSDQVYWVIVLDSAEHVQQSIRVPITGNETILDAFSKVAVSSKSKIWLARPERDRDSCYTVLPVNWSEITYDGETSTNYQLLPGDHIYVKTQEARSTAVDGDAARRKKK